MTKGELLKQLEKYNDNDEIGAFWDDCEWEIHGITIPTEEPRTKFKVLIDCR